MGQTHLIVMRQRRQQDSRHAQPDQRGQGFTAEGHGKQEHHLHQQREKRIHVVGEIDKSVVLQVGFGNGEVIHQSVRADGRRQGQDQCQQAEQRQHRAIENSEMGFF